MTESLSVQDKKSSNAGLWAAGGALIGGGGSALAAKKANFGFKEARYKTMDDILKESKDTLDLSIKDAEGEQKTNFEKIRDAKKDYRSKLNAAFEAAANETDDAKKFVKVATDPDVARLLTADKAKDVPLNNAFTDYCKEIVAKNDTMKKLEEEAAKATRTPGAADFEALLTEYKNGKDTDAFKDAFKNYNHNSGAVADDKITAEIRSQASAEVKKVKLDDASEMSKLEGKFKTLAEALKEKKDAHKALTDKVKEKNVKLFELTDAGKKAIEDAKKTAWDGIKETAEKIKNPKVLLTTAVGAAASAVIVGGVKALLGGGSTNA